jgi:fatty-acyl-CoA synthase
VFTASLGVPVAGADISSIRYAAGGGSAMPVGVSEAIHERTKAPVLEVYGMTETASVIAMAYPDRPMRLGSVGHAVPYSRVRVVKVDAQGQCAGECATNEIGVVSISGPGVFKGYLDERHSRQAFVEPGWVNTGDLGRIDEDGYLWLTGRAKDLIIRGSHNIDPGAIEELFFHHPAVALAAVVGQPDAYAGELPIAFVQLKPDAKVTETELIDYVRGRTPERAAVPVAVIVMAAIPLTAVGKVFKPQLRWIAAQRVYAETMAPLARQGIEVIVSVATHEKHGSLATFAISDVTESAREEIVSKVRELMNPYAQQWEIVWK